jgi:hypothetical protein
MLVRSPTTLIVAEAYDVDPHHSSNGFLDLAGLNGALWTEYLFALM